jgi:hypothetical protein
MSEPDFPEGFQGSGPMFAAVPDLSDQWFALAGKGVTTYVVERAVLAPDGPIGGTAFLDRADAEAVADARTGGALWHWPGTYGWTERTPARAAAELAEPETEP